MSDSLQRGDVVWFAFAWPGPDVTFALVTDVSGPKPKGWDLMFDMEIDIDPSRMSKAPEARMTDSVGFSTGRRNGSFTIQQLADEARQKFGLQRQETP